MITALISFAGGLLNAFLPDIVGYFKKKQEMAERAADRAHEKDMILLQADIQVKLGQQRLEEQRELAGLEAMRAEFSAWAEQMKAIYKAQEPLGIKWVDAWNACLRPAACSVALTILFVSCTIYEAFVIVAWWKGVIPSADIVEHMFKGLVGEFIQAVLGYLFGYRGGNAARAAAQK